MSRRGTVILQKGRGCAEMRETLIEYCTRYDRSELLLQWHPEKNGELTPDGVSYGSQKKSGGSVTGGTNGKARPMPVWDETRDVPTAPEKRSHRDRICARCTRISLPSGIRSKTADSVRRTACPAVTERSGGNVPRGTSGRLWSKPGSRAAAVPSAPTGS